jgi:hypothetical protein
LRNPTPLRVAPGERPPPKPSKPLPRGSTATPAAKPGVKPVPGKAPAARPTGSADKVTAAYQDLLQEIAEKKKQQAEVRKRPPKKKASAVIKATLAVVLPPIAAALWIFNPFALSVTPSGPPPDERGAWIAAMRDAALQVRDWADSTGALPPDLANAGVTLAGLHYQATGTDEFILTTVTIEGPIGVYMRGATFGIGTPPPLPVPQPDSVYFPPDPAALQ